MPSHYIHNAFTSDAPQTTGHLKRPLFNTIFASMQSWREVPREIPHTSHLLPADYISVPNRYYINFTIVSYIFFFFYAFFLIFNVT